MKKVKVECMQEKKVGFEREKDRERESYYNSKSFSVKAESLIRVIGSGN